MWYILHAACTIHALITQKRYVGVGCGNKEEGAQFCLFEADNDTLAKFTDRGSLYTTNVTFGKACG